jgi:hypothetical protein
LRVRGITPGVPFSRGLCCAAASLLLTLVPSAAHAAEVVARGPAECTDARELAFRVERRLGVPLADMAPLRFEAEFELRATGYHARLTVTRPSTPGLIMQRDLDAPDCDELGDALSVAVALALGLADAPAAEDPKPEAPEPEAAPAVPVEAVTPPPVDREAQDSGAEPDTQPSAVVVPTVSLWLLGDAGSLPRPALGLALGAEASWRRFELRLLGTMLLEQQTQVESASSPRAGARLELFTGTALGCAAPLGDPRAELAPLLCLGMELGQLAGEGTGVASPRRRGALWAAPVAQAALSWTPDGSALRMALTLLGAAPLDQHEFALRGIGSVHRLPNVVGRIGFGVGLIFD